MTLKSKTSIGIESHKASDNTLDCRTESVSTRDWGDRSLVSRYLKRCRVDTPPQLVETVWAHVRESRGTVRKVLDFGAGDGRFALNGFYKEYIGYEVDKSLYSENTLPSNATIVNQCPFTNETTDADLCIGNPPYVRHQDLPLNWRREISESLERRTGVSFSGLANAWQYFFVLGLVSTNRKGLCALIIPYEWVSRPSAKALRDLITRQRWNVKVYRLQDRTFANVLTTSSITIVDKNKPDGKWSYFEESAQGKFIALNYPSGSETGVIPYIRRKEIPKNAPIAKRGLSPGTQQVLTLTEGERVRNGLLVNIDVVPCVTTLRPLESKVKNLDVYTFGKFYRNAGKKCWLIRTDRTPSRTLKNYLDSVPSNAYQTMTCINREVWWKFNMPEIPSLLFAQAFKGVFPKTVRNLVNARAVGGVCGIYSISLAQGSRVLSGLDGVDLRGRIVAHSNGFRKIEINQINSLLVDDYVTGLNHGHR